MNKTVISHKSIHTIRNAVFFAILLLTVLFGSILAIRFRNSVVVKPNMAIACDQVVYYNQKNEAWTDDYLGTSSYQMGQSGCLTSCLASVLQMEEIIEKNPKELNQLFSDTQVYDEQGNVQWEALENSLAISVECVDSMTANEIESLLQDHAYPIVRVRMNGIGNFHYVVIVGSKADTFLCMDPLNEKEEVVELSKFQNRIYAVRNVFLTEGEHC